MLEKGQSKRIWGELWKVVDSSDVVVEVLPHHEAGEKPKWRIAEQVVEELVALGVVAPEQVDAAGVPS
mgnify:CR=1 FL=1